MFRVELEGREINRWQFGCVRLWEIDAEGALSQGLPGLAALLPLMKGSRFEHIAQAVRQIEAKAPPEQRSDLLAILRVFGESKYSIDQLKRVIPRERIMESSIYREGRAEGRAEG